MDTISITEEGAKSGKRKVTLRLGDTQVTKYGALRGFALAEALRRLADVVEEEAENSCAHVWASSHKKCSEDGHPVCTICGTTKGGHWCEKSPTKVCEYDEENDPARDRCLHCGEPDERK